MVPSTMACTDTAGNNVTTSTEDSTNINAVTNGSTINDISGGSEAMRIIEGLRQKASTSATSSDNSSTGSILMSQSLDANSMNRPLARMTENTLKRNSISRAQMNEKVRASLNNL